jgi:hypothetical protein
MEENPLNSIDRFEKSPEKNMDGRAGTLLSALAMELVPLNQVARIESASTRSNYSYTITPGGSRKESRHIEYI